MAYIKDDMIIKIGSGDAKLNGGTSVYPQQFTGYTEFVNTLKLSSIKAGNNTILLPTSAGTLALSDHTHSVATTSANGLMSSTDKTNLNTLTNLLSSGDSNTTVDTIREVLNVFANYPEGTTIVNALAGKSDTGHTHDFSSVYAAINHTHSNYSLTSHTHNYSSTYAALSHTHTKANITDFAHTHTKADITDFAHTHSEYLTSHQSLSNYLTLNGSETVSGSKTFTNETKFTHSSYCPTWSDIANGIGKSSCFTRGAFMQMITGQILLANNNYTDTGKGYNTEANKLKFQTMTASSGQPVVTEVASIAADGIRVGGTKVSLEGHTHSQYLTEHQDLSSKANVSHTHTKSNITDFAHQHDNATTSVAGFMSATDKSNLNTLVGLLADNDSDTTVNTIREVLNVFASYPEGTTLANALAGKSNTDHTHSQYLTAHQDISGKVNKSGDTMTGALSFTVNAKEIELRPGHASYNGTISYQTSGNEAVCFQVLNPITSWIFKTGNSFTSSAWQEGTPSLQIKNQKVTINKLIANGAEGAYNLDVNGTANATTLYENGTALSSKYASASSIPTTLPASDVYAWAKASTKPSYSYGEISGRPTFSLSGTTLTITT